MRGISKKDAFDKEKKAQALGVDSHKLVGKKPKDLWYESVSNLDSATDWLCDLGLII